jgi:hypothetical protein
MRLKPTWAGWLLLITYPALLPAEDFVSTIWDEFNQNGAVVVEPSPGLETSDSKEARLKREKEEAKDVALNRSLVRKGYYWLDGRWIKKGEVKEEALEAPRSIGELVDSDHDGYDDFTEVKFHADPMNPDSKPARYFEVRGSNRVIFFSTNGNSVHR